MAISFSVIEGEYLHDLVAQPEAIARTLDGLFEPGALKDVRNLAERRSFRRAVLTGMGSSYHALHPLFIELNRHGLPAIMVETSELVYSVPELLTEDTLLVAVSQSGRSVEIVRLLEREKRPVTIAVTNTSDSPLAQKADAAVLTRAGQEFSVSCKTYVAGLIGLECLSSILCRKDFEQTKKALAPLTAASSEYLSAWKDHVEFLCQKLKGVRDLFLAGRGSSLAAAGTGGLILKESTHLHSEGMSSPSFRHGPMEMLSDSVFVLIFSGDASTAPLNQRLAEDVAAAGGRVALVSDNAGQEVFRLPALADAARPVMEILPVQMMSLALGQLAGREPGKFERATKVTTIE